MRRTTIFKECGLTTLAIHISVGVGSNKSFKDMGSFKCYVTQMGVVVRFYGKKHYEGVRFNDICITRGWVTGGGPISTKKALCNTWRYWFLIFVHKRAQLFTGQWWPSGLECLQDSRSREIWASSFTPRCPSLGMLLVHLKKMTVGLGQTKRVKRERGYWKNKVYCIIECINGINYLLIVDMPIVLIITY